MGKSIDGVLNIGTQDRRMEGADESAQPFKICFLTKVYKMNQQKREIFKNCFGY